MSTTLQTTANRPKSFYYDRIKEILVKKGRPELDPRHIEGYMRLEHPTLDGLTREQFIREVNIGIECIDLDGKENAESCAQSYGL